MLCSALGQRLSHLGRDSLLKEERKSSLLSQRGIYSGLAWGGSWTFLSAVIGTVPGNALLWPPKSLWNTRRFQVHSLLGRFHRSPLLRGRGKRAKACSALYSLLKCHEECPYVSARGFIGRGPWCSGKCQRRDEQTGEWEGLWKVLRGQLWPTLDIISAWTGHKINKCQTNMLAAYTV